MKFLWALSGFMLAVLIACGGTAAPIPAIDIDPGTDVADPPGPGQFLGSEVGNFSSVTGWWFHVEEPVTITHLAWYDENGDGLSHAHRIGLWRDQDSELLVEALVPSGTGGDLLGPWRTVPVASIALPAGAYRIGGTDTVESSDSIVFINSSSPPLLPVAAGIDPFTSAASRLDSVFGPPLPDLLIPSLYLGPMFFIEPVPEPSTVALFAIGAMLLGIRAARRRK